MAIEFTMESLNIYIEIGNKYGQAATYYDLGKIYQAVNDTSKAEEFVQKSLNIAKELELLGVQKQSHRLLSEIFASKEQYKKAYENHILYKEINDNIFNEKNIKNLLALEFQHKFDKEKQEMELAQQNKDIVRAEKEKQQIIIRNAFIAGFILMSLLVLIVFRSFLLKRAANAEIEEKNEELRILNVTKDKFFSIIAHDLRSPFNSLLYLSNLLLEDFKTYDEKEFEEIIKIINDNTKSTYDLLENLLTWAYSQSGKIEYLPQNINIKDLTKNLFLLFEPIAQNKNIKLLDNTESNLLVYADQNTLNTILRNLIANALKFTEKNGTITISASETEKRNLVEISVTDTGIGIPKENLDALFRIDKNVTTLGTEKETGTGLGLLLCKEFVEMNGGNIWVESEIGKGSKFIFTIIAVPEKNR